MASFSSQNNSTLHFTFDWSAANTLCRKLTYEGRDETAIWAGDDYSCGPIAPPDPDLRAVWLKWELGLAPITRGRIRRESHAFWEASFSDPANRIVWFSRRSAAEYCGYLEFVSRLGGLPCAAIDLSEPALTDGVDVPRDHPALSAHQVLLHGKRPLHELMAYAIKISSIERDACHAIWERLRSENGALRILKDAALMSAPIDYFDALILSCVGNRWRKVAAVIGDSMTQVFGSSYPPFSGLIFAERIRSLARAGQFDANGNLYKWGYSEIRRTVSLDGAPSRADR